MTTFRRIGQSFALSLALLFSFNQAHATTISTGAGSAVSSVNATATFNNIVPGLTSWEEDGLRFDHSSSGPGNFNAFNDLSNLNNFLYVTDSGFVEITNLIGSDFQALELRVGDGYVRFGAFVRGPSATTLIWETLRDGNSVGSGVEQTTVGTIFGFFDAAGFDTLRVAAAPGRTDFGPGNAIVIDDVNAQFVSAAVVPIPAAAPLFAGAFAIGGLLRMRRKKGA